METFNISSRRYLGNKYKLSGWIREVVMKNCDDVHSFFDVFSGTGSVAATFLDKRLVVCDMMYCNYLAALCWFSAQQVIEANWQTCWITIILMMHPKKKIICRRTLLILILICILHKK